MKKAKIITIAVFLVTAGLLYGVLANSHIAIFPGLVCERAYEGGTVCDSEMISLLDHNRAMSSYGSEEFNALGWITFIIVMLAVPGGVAALSRKLLKKKKE
ncbi:hypothetical protein HON52_01265 [Candidatus Uhrbacteria bacterium]|jgi:hypothetical protein|nr:hypothetical protein [Candidatus Uhrbacteria bacterium]